MILHFLADRFLEFNLDNLILLLILSLEGDNSLQQRYLVVKAARFNDRRLHIFFTLAGEDGLFPNLESLDNVAARIIKNDQLVRDDSIDDFLLFARIDTVDVTEAVQLGLTAIFKFAAIKHFIDIYCLVAAFVLVESLLAKFNFWGFRMETAIIHLCDRVVLLTAVTPDQVQVRPDLPVDLLPRDAECFPDKGDELF